MIRFKNLSTAQIAALDVRPYPGYKDKYVLLDVPGGTPAQYYRGASHEMLEIHEATVWNEFISTHYVPDRSKKILLLHQCSWAKPYDMSHVLRPIVDICDQFPFVHRLVVSNVGLIPAELQMNSLFCSYDWVPLLGHEPEAVTKAFFNKFEDHLRAYLESNASHYWGILALANRDAGSKSTIIARLAKQFDLPLFLVPDKAGWEKVVATDYRDMGERVRHPLVQEQLKQMLEKIANMLDKQGLIGHA